MPEATRLELGLTSAQVRERVADGRTNDVPARAGRTLGEIVRANVLTRFNAVLGGLFAVIVVVGPLKDGLFGLIVVVNSLVGVVQELRAKRTLERLAIVGEAKPVVWRDGAPVEVGVSEVVLDDVLELGTGDNVVVDGVVVGAEALEVDESLLTGEADPVVKRPGDPVMSGGFAVAGTGRYRATRVGRDAYAAGLAEQAGRFSLVSSELRVGIDRILRFVTWILLPAGALIVHSRLRGDEDLPSALRGAVAALVPMVPEGLVLLTSVAFAVGVVRLGRRDCLVQELPAIEGLARVDVVCADKTGTLTENGLRLAEVRPLLAGFSPDGVLAAFAAADPRPNASLQAVVEAYPPPGDPWPVTAFAAFSSARKWSGASFGDRGNWVLGAPDVLLPRGGAALAAAEDLGAQGLRVLLLARASAPVDAPGAPGDVEPVALVVLAQRVRPDAGETLAYFADQGVAVKVISGDDAVAVGAVVASLGLVGATAPVDARDLPAVLRDEVEAGTVFGRVTPAQKRDMVGALQARGHTVAMTGDGVNGRAGAQGRRHRRRDGLRQPGHTGRRPDRAARRPVRHAAVRRRRAPPRHRQRRARRQPVPRQDRLLGAARRPHRGRRLPVPVPAAAPHPHRRPHDRHPGLLPRARAERRARPRRLRPVGPGGRRPTTLLVEVRARRHDGGAVPAGPAGALRPVVLRARPDQRQLRHDGRRHRGHRRRGDRVCPPPDALTWAHVEVDQLGCSSSIDVRRPPSGERSSARPVCQRSAVVGRQLSAEGCSVGARPPVSAGVARHGPAESMRRG
jgi:hypothetical protein